ncbi:uncharacterized protein LOC124626150 isoform X1 [Ictalurus punctatus]|uniref:Uncharacterized protein LOC124626150 isoform X1 n=1 Tax=Ictalurus punctatus TaxID=7998 RepID=A0A9F7QUM9_ICTPU|nr:uncharacterized protein LOC124626150 isoform X1 [Ictalurus punctatus]XP_053530483.1 uncharacterized protein LOC124626150 isoform X1 [Ictalurus punctatus]XP_053530484.1 uncharacterized protein LOC124626150 isoform X1 [Ictalurus punctatus]XP_053530485.1 uncharacterized protein LOC124626150 isoform X1 [Ictalurus punctatus]
MHLCAGVILLLVPCVVLSVDRQKVFGNLHESASLPCTVQCSGELTWTRFQKQDDVLVRCSSVSCWSRDGFIVSYEQYLKGNSSLTMLKADYSLRGLYMAKCVSETVCEVVFTLSPLEMTRVIAPGEPIDVLLPLTDLVEVSFTPSDAVQPSNLQICSVDKEKIQCSPDYKERASLLKTLQIKDGNVSDSGNYTVQDKVNDESIAIVTVHMRGSKPDELGSGSAPVSQTRSRGRRSVSSEPCPDIKQQEGVPVWVVVLILMLLLVVVSVLVVGYVMHVRLRREVQQLRENAENSRLALLQQNGNGNHPGEESNLKNP